MSELNQAVLRNPLKVDFHFSWDAQPYVVKAGEVASFPAFLAQHGAKHMVDYIILHKETWGQLELKRTSDSVASEREEIESIVLSLPKEVLSEEPTEQEEKPKKRRKKKEDIEDGVKEDSKDEEGPKEVEEFADLKE